MSSGFVDDEVAVVTGAASGVGEAVASLLLERGVAVIGVDITSGAASDVRWVEGDVADDATWESVLKRAAEFGAPPKLLVSNAAVAHVGTVLELTDQAWQETFAVNVLGAVKGIRALVPEMKRGRRGSIVTVASVDAFMAEQGLAAYCSSKGALLQLTRCCALDFARDGIRANCVCPGVIDTPFFRRHLETATDPDRFLEARIERNPLGRLLEPRDVAETIVFLLSERSAGTTGAQVTVDAGLSTGFDFRTGAEGA